MTHYFPLDLIAENLSRWGCKVRAIEGGITWDIDRSGRSEITIQEATASTFSGNDIVAVVRFRHFFLGDSAKEITAMKAANWNMFASLSALLPTSQNEGPCLVSRVTLYHGDEDAAQRIYAPIMATEAYIQPAALVSAARGTILGPSYFGLSCGEDATPYGEQDFMYAKEQCIQESVYANAGIGGITVEFPYDPGAVSSFFSGLVDDQAANATAEEELMAQLGGRTFLLTIRANERHPVLGVGLFSLLRLPISFRDSNTLVDVVNKLNKWEFAAFDMPPMFGGWCVDPKWPSPAFAMFLPNELCNPGMPRTIVAWMGHRARRIVPELAAVI